MSDSDPGRGPEETAAATATTGGGGADRLSHQQSSEHFGEVKQYSEGIEAGGKEDGDQKGQNIDQSQIKTTDSSPQGLLEASSSTTEEIDPESQTLSQQPPKERLSHDDGLPSALEKETQLQEKDDPTSYSPVLTTKEHKITHDDALSTHSTINQNQREPSPIDDLSPADEERALPLSQQQTTESISKSFSPIHEFFFVGVICAAQLYTQASLNQTLGLGRQLSASFHITDRAEQAWFVAGYSLTVGTFILFSGRLGDMFGYKRILIIGYCWFGIWSIIAGLAVYADAVLFIWARVLTGIGPALCMPNALAILGATYPPGLKKSMFFSLFGAAAPSGAVLGLTFAGLFNLTYWPWAFWAIGIAILCTAVLAHIVITEIPPRRADHARTPQSYFWDLDIPGVFVGVAALVTFNFAWNQAPLVGWDKAEVIATLVVGVILIGAFFYIEIKVSHSPLIPFEVLKAEVSLVLAMMGCGWACFGIWIYYVFQILQVLQNASPLLVAAKICPVAITGAIAAICTGFLLQRLGPSIVMCISLVAFTVGAALVATVPIHQTYWAQLFVTMIIIPWGMDMSFPAATLILSNAVAREHQGVAASLVNTVVNYSISISLGIAGTIEVNVNNGGKTQHDLQNGYRGAMYLAVGLSVFGLMMGVVYTLNEKLGLRRKNKGDAEKEAPQEGGT